jgi:hypothetical protein
MADQIAAALTARGFVAQRNHGQSDLKCHIAVKGAEDDHYRLAVQIDDSAHYGNPDLAARYVVRPSILAAFGWTVMTVLAKDWLTAPDKVIERIAERLAGRDRTPPRAPSPRKRASAPE